MSNFSISSLFPFRRVKIEDFSQLVDPDNGMAMFTTVSPDFRFNPICHECGSEADRCAVSRPFRVKFQLIA